jgi:hypothetical protein
LFLELLGILEPRRHQKFLEFPDYQKTLEFLLYPACLVYLEIHHQYLPLQQDLAHLVRPEVLARLDYQRQL